MRTAFTIIIAIVFLSVLTNEPPTHKDAQAQAVSKPVAVVKPVDKPVAPIAPPTPVVAPPVAPTPVPQPAPVPVAPAPLPANAAKAFIYQHESGNNPAAINRSSGACGLGQALPCSKLPCTLVDYTCQDIWFTNYALQRYGSWAAAYNFWVAHNWW